MAQDWFLLSIDDGSLESTKAPAESKPYDWIERDLENILALNPDLLDVADHLPLRLGGVRGTVTSPDQAFVDVLGRLVVVEVKKIHASLSVISQVIAYADQWRLMPRGEIDRGLRDFAHEGRRSEIFGRALSEVRSWANGDDNPELDADRLQGLGKIVLKRLAPEWIARAAIRCEQLPCIGAPARIIAVAPSFRDECIEFAEQLTQRMVGIELIKFEIVKSRGRIYLGRGFAHRDPDSEPTWRLLRRAWSIPQIRDQFTINGWADALNRESFSLSVREVADAKFWIWASNTEANITTVMPDGWYKSDLARRKEIRAKFLDALPKVDNRSERWMEWEFKLPGQQPEVNECLIGVANAIREVLVPAAPSRSQP